MITLDLLIEQASKIANPVVAVAAAADVGVLTAVESAIQQELATFILYDDEAKLYPLIETQFSELLRSNHVQMQHTETLEVAAEEAVKSVSSGHAHVLMKGNLPTSVILKAVLHSTYGLRTGKVLSHVAAFEVPGYERLVFVTDAAMNIAPSLEEKAQIINNAVSLAHACGIDKPIVAPLAAIETINPVMLPTRDAASLVLMNQRGQIQGCTIEGPLALDNAISVEAARQKGLTSEVAGRADILLVPNIEAGNILYKSLIYFANAKVGAIIQGAKAPIVLTSRADSADSKLFALALAILSTKN